LPQHRYSGNWAADRSFVKLKFNASSSEASQRALVAAGKWRKKWYLSLFDKSYKVKGAKEK